MIAVNDQPVHDGDRVAMRTRDPLEVEGPRLVRVSIDTADLEAHDDGVFRPTGRLLQHLRHSTGEATLRIERVGGEVLRVALVVEPVRLGADEVAQMRAALGALAASFEEPSLIAEVMTEVADEDGSRGEAVIVGAQRDEEQTMRALFVALERHLPPLLDAPLKVQRLEAGPTPISRARLSPRSILARKLRGDRGQILDLRRVEGGAPGDYGWLAGLVATVEAYAGRRVRSRRSIAFGADDEALRHWRDALDQLAHWKNHPELAGRPQSGQPSWILSRSGHGAALMKQARAAHVQYRAIGRGASEGAIRQMVRMRVVDDAHLYELWVLLSIVEVLRENFGFVFADGEPQHFANYARFEGGRVAFEPIRLIHRGEGLDGRPVELRALLEFEPEVAARSGGFKTPDIVLTIDGGAGDEDRRTVHVLDAKYSTRRALSHVEQTARGGYLQTLDPRPTGSYVVLPHEGAEFSRVLEMFRQRRMRRLKWAPKFFQYHDQEVEPGSPYGLAWGAFHASPESGPLGIRQFVTIALQYHRTELRHICGQCGERLTLSDVGSKTAQSDRRKLRAHHDAMDHEKISGDLLLYTCPRCRYQWSRHRCYYGHVLMKHGRLTPHRQIDADHNVECSVCGHFKQPARPRDW